MPSETVFKSVNALSDAWQWAQAMSPVVLKRRSLNNFAPSAIFSGAVSYTHLVLAALGWHWAQETPLLPNARVHRSRPCFTTSMN